MKIYTTNRLSRWAGLFGLTLAIILMVSAVAVSQAVAPVLGTSNSYGILAAGAITGTTAVHGNVGTTTGSIAVTITAATGWQVFASGIPSVVTAHNDFGTAYTNALAANPGVGTSLPATFPGGAGNPGGSVATALVSGIYTITAPASMSATLYLTGAGIFIFKTSSTFNTTAAMSVILGPGATWDNIYWLVGGAVTLGAGSSVLEGSILCNVGAVTMTGPNSVDGRVLCNGAVGVGTATIGNAAIPLPVEMVSFAATTSGLNAQLRWSTATEVNNYGFEIQRRSVASGLDAQWQKAGFVPGAGTSSSPRQYSYTDRGLTQGQYAYRIKQIDKNGSFKYSSAAQVEVGSAPKEFALSQSYPNPFNPSTTVEFSVATSDKAVVKVFNVLGQEVATIFDGTAEAGKMYQARFDASRMSSGMYYVRLQSNGQAKMQKIVFLK